MAITFSGLRKFSTHDMPGHMFSRALVASQSFKVRIDSATPSSVPDGLNAFTRSSNFCFQHSFSHGFGSTVAFNIFMDGSGNGGASHQFLLTIGTTYVFVVVWDGSTPVQKCWASGVPTVMAHVAGIDSTWTGPAEMGPNKAQGAIVFTLDDYHSWDNYALTQADAVYLTNNGDPTLVGTGAPWRCHWTLAGTTGQNAAVGDAGLRNAYGTGGTDGSDFASVTGGGTAVYAEPLVWAPTVTSHPYVCGSGKNIGFTFTSNLDATLLTPSQLLATPTIKINGTDHGALTIPWGGHTTVHHQCMLFSTPGTPPLQIGPSDVVELTSPPAWANTPAGSVAALAGTIDNRTGKSSVQTELFTKILRMGVGHAGTGGLEYYPFKNAKYKTGVPTNYGKLQPGHGYQIVNQPSEMGKILLVWDAIKPATPAIMSLRSNAPTRVTVTHLSQYDVSPTDGIGYVRVYEAAGIPGSDFETVVGGSGIGLNYDDPAYTGTSNYANLWIYLKGEWSLVDGAPVFDRSDPFALSNFHFDRIHDVGCIRGTDITACGGACASYPYPELLISRNIEFFWGYQLQGNKKVGRFGFTSMEPVDPVATPWIYSALFRQPENLFSATLSAAVTTAPAVGTNETWHFSDGATAPLMAGLEVQVDDEIVRILSGADTDWVVYRGSNGTTPATHAPGPVTVFGRVSVLKKVKSDGTVGYSSCVLIRCDKPHGMTSRHGYAPSRGLSWTATDGTVVKNMLLGAPWVTGPDTFIAIWSGYFTSKPNGLKPNGVYPLDPTTNGSENGYLTGTPIDVFCELVGRYPHANMVINIPVDACDDMVYAYAWRCRDHFPAGRKIYVEWANEPWNWAPPYRANGHCHEFGGVAMPNSLKTSDLAYYSYRSAQVHAIFRSVFTAAGRADEIMGSLNCQLASGASQITPYLNYGLAAGQPFDAVMCAPYYSMTAYPASVTTFNQYDDDQAAELMLHDVTYDPTTLRGYLRNNADAVKAYNAAHGKSCILMGYEGALDKASPAGSANMEQRNHNVLYNPGIYHVHQSWMKILQEVGFVDMCAYAVGLGWPLGIGMYHARSQQHSRGDGLNGAVDNRALAIVPGTPSGIGPLALKQDSHADSVCGQALIDWNAQLGSPVTASYTFVAPSPSSGLVGVASGLFTVQPDGPYTGTITIAVDGGGLSTSIVLTWSSSSVARTFSVTPTLAGTVTLTPTNSGSLTDPDALIYTVTEPPGTPLTVWFGSWFGRWFTVSPTVAGIVRGGESATSFLDVDAPRLQRRFVPFSRRSYHPPGR